MLRGDVVKDDSGAYAVFTEQGSSASQMTAAQLMDVIARLVDCARQAADALSAHTQVKTEDTPRLLKILGRTVQIWAYVFHDTSGQHLGQTWKIQWFLLNEICTDIHLRASCGKDNSKKFCWGVGWKKYRIDNAHSFIENKDCSCRCTWMTSKWLEESRTWLQCGRHRCNLLSWEKTHTIS